MPAGKTGGTANPAERTVFRPPWVKAGPDPEPPAPKQTPPLLKQAQKRDSTSSSSSTSSEFSISSIDSDEPVIKFADVQLKRVKLKEPDEPPTPTAEKENPLENVKLRKVTRQQSEREPFRKEKENNPLAGVQLRKTSIQSKEPPKNGEDKDSFFKKPQLKPVPQREKSPPKKDHKIKDLPKLSSVSDRKLPERKQSFSRKDSVVEELPEIDKELPEKRNSLVRAESMRRLSQAPAPPPMPPPAPGMPGELTKPLTNKQKARLDLLKSRPKVRPDWSATLKEIEGGRKLRHVECNDRSEPLLPEAKAQEHFLYASEKPNVHNELLKQIESGIKLKKVVTIDRSKPNLEGLRKLRRQMTIEEQIQKSISMASMPPEEIAPEEVDEMDDIDRVRDDLQSTKQMLALELRNKEAQEMENKRLLARLANMEAELNKLRSSGGIGGGGGGGNVSDDKVLGSLKKEAEQSRKQSEQLEKKYTEAVKDLDTTKIQLEENKRKNIELEKKLMEALGGKRVSLDRKNSVQNGETSDLEFEEDESNEESDGEDTEEKRMKKLEKEVKNLRNKLRNFKHKEDNAKKERVALKHIIRNNQLAIKDENKKYNRLKKEVDKMAVLLKDVSEDDEEDEDKEENDDEDGKEDEESEEEDSSEEESETESDDSESERSQSEDEDAPGEKKKTNLTSRTKRHENLLAALKKGNFLLKSNAERLQDDLNKQKELTAALQEDLDSVLSELG